VKARKQNCFTREQNYKIYIFEKYKYVLPEVE